MRRALPEPARRLLAPGRRTVGVLPSAWVVGVCVAVAILADALLADGPALSVEVACLAVVLVYCALRPADGLTVLGLAVLPAAASAIVGDGFEIPRWTIALPLSGVMLAFLVAQDREDRARRASQPAPAPPA
ncbi:hypothetical protein [Conexibacter woesei]|uniref:Uncharacterized protein n=1 Tax=Conexibacter woesei (strain DSM 14684 / CCUG 47730 / CIP 108061 / JCM 11494 / NBRC 100937 / ID131577) TaxID=469383 RepID=D3FCS4_CONWI|nr:hypothetical protein [Conexibacter woesei]ADB51436.1 hypothetical protein Cwoe_3017 [Conexibacter woesei DSM 14684]